MTHQFEMFVTSASLFCRFIYMASNNCLEWLRILPGDSRTGHDVGTVWGGTLSDK